MSRFNFTPRLSALALSVFVLVSSASATTILPEEDSTGPVYTFVTAKPVAQNLAEVCSAIRYPDILTEMRLEGTVFLRVLVYTEGKPARFEFTDHAHPLFQEANHAINAPKGELGFNIKSDGTGSPWRLKIKSPSFANLQVLERMMEGSMVADTVVLIGSIDPVMGEADK